MSTTATPQHESKSVLAHYILFRHMQKANQRGWISPQSQSSSALWLRDSVTRSWERLFPQSRGEAQSWARDRLELLRDMELLPERSLPLLQQRLRAAQASADIGLQRGALAFMLKLHWLYIELAEAVDGGQIPAEYLPRLHEIIHEKALDSANQILKRHQPFGQPTNPFLDEVLRMARGLVGDLEQAGAIRDAEARYLEGALQPLPKLSPGPTKDGIGACQVCGFDILAATACWCGQCETPHHRDCWTYNEGCAMFACRGKNLLEGEPAAIH